MTRTRTATCEEILQLLCDLHRLGKQIDPFGVWGSNAELNPEMSIAHWGKAQFQVVFREPIPIRRASRWLSEVFDTELRVETCAHLLRSPRERTLGDLAAELAKMIRLPVVEELDIVGRKCLPAAIFRRLQTCRFVGPTGKSIQPSAPLGQNSLRVLAAWSVEVPRLAPGVMPERTFRYRRDNRGNAPLAGLCTLILWSTILSLSVGSWLFGLLPAGIVFVSSLSLLSLFHRVLERISGGVQVHHSGLSTVSDLCRAIASRHIQPAA